MTKKRLIFVSMSLLFVLVTFAVITTLAIPTMAVVPSTDIKTEGGGSWLTVCCGSTRCGTAGDYCIGTGTYTCCK